MFTTRMSPKMSEKPLATMKRRPANVSPSRIVVRNAPKSSNAEPKFVVRQFPPPSGGAGCARKRTYAIPNRTSPPATSLGAS